MRLQASHKAVCRALIAEGTNMAVYPKSATRAGVPMPRSRRSRRSASLGSGPAVCC